MCVVGGWGGGGGGGGGNLPLPPSSFPILFSVGNLHYLPGGGSNLALLLWLDMAGASGREKNDNYRTMTETRRQIVL